MSENLNEGRSQIKRKYGDYSNIRVNEKAPIRNKIVNFIGKRFVTEEELKSELTKLTEETGKAFDERQWFKRNQRYFESFENRGQKVWTLSKYGKRVHEFINKPKENTIMENQSIGLFKNELFESIINEGVKKHKGREVYPEWIDPNRDFGKPVKSRRELKAGAEYIIWEQGMDTWQAEYIYQGNTDGKHIFNSSTQFGDGEPMEFTDEEIDEYIKSGDIIKQN